MGSKLRTGIVLSLLFGMSFALLSSPVSAADRLDWEFDVLLDDKKIGFHRFSVSEDGERTILETKAAFDVKVLFVTAFKYRHSNTEIWTDGCLASIDARTNSNGKTLEVTGERDSGALSVATPNGEKEFDNCVKSFAYWNPRVLDATRLLNSQTGEYEDVTVIPDGDDLIDVDGQPRAAERYTLKTKGGDIKLWYSKNTRTWLALEAPAKGGRTIRYTPVVVPDNRSA